MAALEKIIASAAGAAAAGVDAGHGDPAPELVLAARTAAQELLVHLASDDDEDDDSGGKGGSDSGGGHASHATYKALLKKGVPPAKASQMCAQADKKVAATALADAVVVALSGLVAAEGDWVESTAYDHLHSVALAGATVKSPYGDVQYGDPGHQADGKKRYPLDNETHVRAAWSYINQGKNGAKYSPSQLSAIKSKILLAAKKHGIQIGGDDGEKVAATMVALAARQQEAFQAMHHGPHTGKHAHGHLHQVVSGEEHFHNNDSDHSRHTASASEAW